MHINIITDRFNSTSLRAELPVPPHNVMSQAARRTTARLRFQDRGRFKLRAFLIAIVSLACVGAGILANNTVILLIGCLGLPIAIYYFLLLTPSQLESLANQADSECERALSQFAAECTEAAMRFTAAASSALERECQSGVSSGASLASVAEFKVQAKSAFMGCENAAAQQLAGCQSNINTLRQNVQNKRNAYAAVCRQTKAKFIAGPARRAARDLIDAIINLAERRLGETMLKAESQSFRKLVEETSDVPQADAACPVPRETPIFQLPPWLGTPLPGREVLEEEARKLVDANIKTIRAKLVQTGNAAQLDEILNHEVDRLFASASGPASVEECVVRLNGSGRAWARSVLSEAAPLAAQETFPDKRHHKKVFLLTAGATESSAFENVRATVPEQWTEVVAQDHPASEMVCITVEEATSFAEYPEIVGLMNELRALPDEEFDALTTVCDPQVLREFFPERTEADCSPAPLLASALVFEIIRRSGAQNYSYDGEIVGKGCQGTLAALKDATLAARIQNEVMRQVSAEGLVSATTKLAEAKKSATKYVPKDFAGRTQFCQWIDDAITHLNRRLINPQIN